MGKRKFSLYFPTHTHTFKVFVCTFPTFLTAAALVLRVEATEAQDVTVTSLRMVRLKLCHKVNQFHTGVHQLAPLTHTVTFQLLLYPLKDNDWTFTRYVRCPGLILELLTSGGLRTLQDLSPKGG